jgi:LysM repeat protein
VEQLNKKNQEQLIANERLIKQLRKNIKYLYNYSKRIKAKNKKLIDWIKALPTHEVSEQKKDELPKIEKNIATTSKFALRKKLVKTLFLDKKESVKHPAKRSFRYYTVKSGDSLGKISQKVYGTTKYYLEIKKANRNLIKSSKHLKIGQRLKIPNL